MNLHIASDSSDFLVEKVYVCCDWLITSSTGVQNLLKKKLIAVLEAKQPQ